MPLTTRQRIDALIAAHEGLRTSVRHDLGVTVDGDPGTRRLGLASGFEAIDGYLPWQGWPVGAMTELLHSDSGRGELSLLLPALARRTESKHQVVVIGAPHALYAAGLQQAGVDAARVQQIGFTGSGGHGASTASRGRHIDALWAAEQVLKSGTCGAVLLWTHHCAPDALRRLHLAVLQQDTALFHFREPGCAANASPAWLRLLLSSNQTELQVQVLKCRGHLLSRPLITLDRRQVQSRVFQQLRGNTVLDQAIRFGVGAKVPVQAQAQTDALLDALRQCDPVLTAETDGHLVGITPQRSQRAPHTH